MGASFPIFLANKLERALRVGRRWYVEAHRDSALAPWCEPAVDRWHGELAQRQARQARRRLELAVDQAIAQDMIVAASAAH